MNNELIHLEENLKNILPNITETMLSQLHKYYEILVDYSKKMNLTTITTLDGVYIKHFYDSLLLGKSVDLSCVKSLLDVGTGAGFPGLVIKICFPNIKVVLLEPTRKRCDFLNVVISTLGLKDIDVINERAENYIKNQYETFDIVCARAVAGLNILMELCVPFVKKHGNFVALKGSSFAEEIKESNNATKKLLVKLIKTDEYSLINDEGKRAILVYEKLQNTPRTYPRSYAKIKSLPL